MHDGVALANVTQGELEVLFVILTYTRYASLTRLLSSLSRAKYPGANVHLHIAVDFVDTSDADALLANQRCAKISMDYLWPHGRKTVVRRLSHTGLSQSWFESPYGGSHDFISIFEDDIEVHPHFFRFFSLILSHGSLASPAVTGFCFHPDDWDVTFEKECDDSSHSDTLYLSPEPCNWAPIWKHDEWLSYLEWVWKLKAQGEMPFVPEEVSFEYNSFLREGKDVQSSWVWRYNYEFNKQQVRYSLLICSETQSYQVYMAVNHKEAGEHFSHKMDIDNDPQLLQMDPETLYSKFVGMNSFIPAPFPGYEVLSRQGADKLG